MTADAHLAAAFQLASAGGRNDQVLQPVAQGGARRSIGTVSGVSASDAPAPAAGATPPVAPGAPTSAGPNAPASPRMAAQGHDTNAPWAPGMESFPSRVPVSTDGRVKTIYAKNVDVVSGPGPARKLAENVLSSQNAAILGRPIPACEFRKLCPV